MSGGKTSKEGGGGGGGGGLHIHLQYKLRPQQFGTIDGESKLHC